MSDHDVLQRIRAYASGRPLARGTTLHLRRPSPSDLRLAFLRMGGETSPWGIAWSAGKARPEVLTVPEPRDREAVAAMVETFAPVLLDAVAHPTRGAARAGPCSVWLPGPTHLEMVHHLAVAYASVEKTAEPRRSTLRALSRAATWLFRESQRAGQTSIVDASWALRESFAFPADDLRQAHLGFLFAWLSAGDRDARLRRAQDAERRSVGTTLDPVLERKELEPRIEKLRDASGPERQRLAARIADILQRELLSRLDALEAARDVLARDERDENPGLLMLLKQSTRSWTDYARREQELAAGKAPWVPNPLADHGPLAPARAMRWAEAYQEVAARALTHHDRDLQMEWVAAGEAIAGKVVDVRDESAGRASEPVWTIDSPGHGPLKLRPGSGVVVAREEGRTAKIRSIERTRNGRRVVVEIEGWKRGPTKEPRPDVLPATDPRQRGRDVVLLESGPDPIGMLLKSHYGERNGPGSWLTRKLAAAAPAEEV